MNLPVLIFGFLDVVHPGLFFLGIAAIASPIIIHLLNKRKFKRIDWAAMDFLLEADKKNRRRVRLENLLLLLLRCAACILIGLLLARLFIPLGLTAGMFGAEEYERIVLLDDSLSMSVKDGTETSMQKAKAALASFVRGLADNGSRDQFTLYLVSDPTQPLYNGEQIDAQKANEIAADIEEELRVSDKPANLAASLLQVEEGLEGEEGSSLNQIVYVVSDMRSRDWPIDQSTDEKEGVTATLRRVADATAGCYLVDVGREDDVGNVFIEQIESKEKALVAGVPSDFAVTVRNAGKQDAQDVQVRFVAGFQDGGELPLEETVDRIPAGGEVSVPFKFAFSREELLADEDKAASAKIRAELELGGADAVDELQEDNTRYFAARVAPGIRTLIVDGDRLPNPYESESFFLARALAPPGDQLSGMAVDVVGESQFENLRLDDYQVIYLCNLYRIPDAGVDLPGELLSDDEPSDEEPGQDDSSDDEENAGDDAQQRLSRREQLEKWVANGGGLVIAMGDRIDEDVYNRELYRQGKGLLPIKLDTILGDVDEEDWVHFNVEQRHPVMSLFADEGSPFVEFVKIFRWWDCVIDEAALKTGKVNVVAEFTNAESSPAVVEKQFGQGRVFVFTMPLDKDWSDWPQDHSFVPTMIELNKYLARKTADDANVQVGDALEQALDLTHFELEVGITRPDDATGEAEVSPADGATGDQVLYRAKYDEVDRQGFYQVVLNRRNLGGPQPMLFAANIDPSEGHLARADTREFQRKLGDAKVQFVSESELLTINIEDARKHLWPWVMGSLVGVLFLEQFLGWLFGRSR